MDPEVVALIQRGRLIAALGQVVSENGYAAATVNQIVAEAGTSKRTFYENFRDKEDCYLQSYAAVAEILMDNVDVAQNSAADPAQRFEDGMREYLRLLSGTPAFTRAFFLEVGSAGPAALELRSASLDEFANRLLNWRKLTREAHPELPMLTKMQALSIIWSIMEFVTVKMRADGPERVPEITDELLALFKWMMRP